MASKLKEAREKAGYTIEEVADILKIRKQYLLDLEEEAFDDIPGEVYVKGYSKIYHEFLGLKVPKKNVVTVHVPKAVRIDNKIEAKHVVIMSAVILALVVVIYVFMQMC
jgi:transcriptional regulator with XRE-family HTH domain